MRPPCDEAVIRSVDAEAPCRAEARGWILAATILGSSMAFIDSTVVNVALPALQASFHATVVDVQWVVEVYGLLLAALILVGGSLGDLLGRRLMFIVGVAVFAVASMGCGVASNIQQLIVARGIQGVGAALLVPGSLAIISASFDEQSRGQAIGTWSGFTAITTAVGPVLVGCTCLIVFVFVEASVTSPMVPLALFASPSFSGANLLTLFLYAAIGIFFFLFPLNLIQVQGYSATAAGAAALPLILLIFLLSRWSGGLVTRYGPRLPLIIGPLVAALGFALFAVSSVGGSYWKTFFPAVVVLGFGMAITVAPLTTVVMNSVDRDHVGAASGINNAVARVAGVLAIAVLGIVMVSAFSYRLNRQLANLSLPDNLLYDIKADEIKLAGLQLPAGIDDSTTVGIRDSIGEAFVFGFRLVILICAGLSVASAAVAWLLIPKGAFDLSSARLRC